MNNPENEHLEKGQNLKSKFTKMTIPKRNNLKKDNSEKEQSEK